MLSTRESLSIVYANENYSIDLVTKNEDGFSMSIQLTRLPKLNDETKKKGAVIATFPLDFMDNTLVGVLEKEKISALVKDEGKEQAGEILKTFSEVLEKQIGAKQFIVLPAETHIPNHEPVQDATFKRLRYVSHENLNKNTYSLLKQYEGLFTQLNETCSFAIGILDLTEKLENPYEEVFNFLAKHADFTEEKMTEYKQEGIQGIKARLDNGNVTPIFMLGSDGKLCGMIRCLSMSGKFAYLSDETINQDIIPLVEFYGESKIEKRNARSIFLLAYLTSKVCEFQKNKEHFLLIAAKGREKIYEEVMGPQTFPINSDNDIITIRLKPPGARLTVMKQRFSEPFFAKPTAATGTATGRFFVGLPQRASTVTLVPPTEAEIQKKRGVWV